MGTDLLVYLGGLALLDTLSPTIIGVTLFIILKNKENAASRLLTYLFTVALLYFALGTGMMYGLHYLIDTFTTIFQDKIFSRAIFVSGIILFTASFFIPANKKKNIPTPKTQSIFSILVIGITTFLIEAGSAFPYFAAIGLLTTNNIPPYQWLPLIAIYNIIMVLPAILIFLGYKLFGRRIDSNLIALHNKLSNSSNSALSWIMCIVGLLLIFNTLDYL